MEIDELVRAVQTLNAEDSFRARLTLENWRVIAPYLARYEIRAGDLLIKQGDADRSMYFISQGSMQVFVTGGPPGSNKVAILRAGAVVGEPGLFGDTPRTANVEAMTAIRGLGPARPAHGRAGAALAGARPRAAARRRRRDGGPLPRQPDPAGAGDLSGRAPPSDHRRRPRRWSARAQQLFLGQGQRLRQAREHQRVAGRQAQAVLGLQHRARGAGAPRRR